MATYGVNPYRQAQAQPQVDPTVANGAYNPMYHQANQQPITLKDLASLYLKSQGQGALGDDPHLWRAVNTLAGSRLGGDDLGGGGPQVMNAADLKSLLLNKSAIMGGRQALFDQLTQQVNQRYTENQAKQAGYTPAQAKAIAQDKAAQAGSGGGGGGGGTQLTPDTMGAWFQSYVSPYMDTQQAYLDTTANLFDQQINDIMQNASPETAQLIQAYAPLISSAYHQKAANFARNFLYGDDQQSLIGQLLKKGKRNSSILNFLKGQASDSSGGGLDSFFAAAGIPTGKG